MTQISEEDMEHLAWMEGLAEEARAQLDGMRCQQDQLRRELNELEADATAFERVVRILQHRGADAPC